MKKKNIVVLYGGDSNERIVSLKTGLMISKNINKKKYNVKLIDTKKEIFKIIDLAKKKNIDLAFIALHGKGGEDGSIQGFLETLKIKYTGSGILASVIGMDKEITKTILTANKIKTPNFSIINKESNIKKNLTFPSILKPINEGSS
ncbi:D-alanine--D-alanine ligase, partial [bacterium CG_4_10_14_0_8_um_filter_33_57]